MFLTEMVAAKAWNKDPDEWYARSREARAVMVATVRAVHMIAGALAPETKGN